MMVNNEIGVRQPVSAICEMVHKAGALMMSDAVQAFGRVEVCHGPDLVAISAHKIHGPKGIGALWMRKGKEPAPLIHGGGQELGLRSGTLSPELCVGFGAAAKLADERCTRDYDHVQRLWKAAVHALGPGWKINGSIPHRYQAISTSAVKGLMQQDLLQTCAISLSLLGAPAPAVRDDPAMCFVRSDSIIAKRDPRSALGLDVTQAKPNWSRPVIASPRPPSSRRSSTRDPGAVFPG